MARSKGARERKRPSSADYAITVSWRTARALLIPVLVLLTCHAVLVFYHYKVEPLPSLLLQLFDVDQENNLPTWYSGFLLMVAAALLGLLASKRREQQDRWAPMWLTLAIGFLLMSLDEVAGVHESINSVIIPTWAYGGAVVVLALGALFIPFLRSLPPRTRNLFMIAGTIYLSGAVALEFPGNEMVASGYEKTLGYALMTLLEEALEMCGVVLFIRALIDYMRGAESGVRASVGIGAS